jgi:hypothetical protein
MQQATVAEPFQEMVVGAFVGLRRRSLKSVCRVTRDVQTEQFVYAESNATLRKPQLNILVYRVRDEIRTIFAGGPPPIGRVESTSTRWTSVPLSDVTSDPPLYPMPHKSKVNDSPASLAMTIDQLRFAGRTRRRS